jgi:hypothetical protein
MIILNTPSSRLYGSEGFHDVEPPPPLTTFDMVNHDTGELLTRFNLGEESFLRADSSVALEREAYEIVQLSYRWGNAEGALERALNLLEDWGSPLTAYRVP